jgi:hypothetical protein
MRPIGRPFKKSPTLGDLDALFSADREVEADHCFGDNRKHGPVAPSSEQMPLVLAFVPNCALPL